jgi:hypothetical protein
MVHNVSALMGMLVMIYIILACQETYQKMIAVSILRHKKKTVIEAMYESNDFLRLFVFHFYFMDLSASL